MRNWVLNSRSMRFVFTLGSFFDFVSKLFWFLILKAVLLATLLLVFLLDPYSFSSDCESESVPASDPSSLMLVPRILGATSLLNLWVLSAGSSEDEVLLMPFRTGLSSERLLLCSELSFLSSGICSTVLLRPIVKAGIVYWVAPKVVWLPKPLPVVLRWEGKALSALSIF